MRTKKKRVTFANDHTETELFYPALHIPEILEYIFQFCHVQDLKDCRLVSKAWNAATAKSWRASAAVKLYKIKKPNESNSMYKFLEMIDVAEQQASFNHYDKFTLEFVLKKNQLIIFNSFWIRCGPQIKILNLSREVSLPTASVFRSILFQYCPNLEELHVEAVSIIEDIQTPRQSSQWIKPQFGENNNLRRLAIDPDDIEFCGISWMELLSHFPCLEDFRLLTKNGITILNTKEIDQIYKAVSIIRKHDPTKLRLKNLFALYGCDDKHQDNPFLFKLLTDSNLSLKEIAVKINGKQGSIRLNQILGLHEATLQKLELERKVGSYLNPADCFVEQIFGNLTELNLHSRVFRSMTFLKFTPNLKKLAVNSRSHKWRPNNIVASTPTQDMTNIKLEKCTDLEVDTFLSCDEINSLMSWFPKVTRLKMALDNTTLSFICQLLPEIVSLGVIGSKVDECGLTGLDKEHVDMVNKAEWNNKMGSITTVRRANVTSLKYLQALSLKGRVMDNSHEFGFCSALYGFLQMSSLKTLTLGEYELTTDTYSLFDGFRHRLVNLDYQFVKSGSIPTDIDNLLKRYRTNGECGS